MEIKFLGQLIKDIKKKKDFSDIEDKYIETIIKKELKKNKKLHDFLEKHELKTISRSEKYKNLIKAVRRYLREKYSMFKKEGKNKNILERHLSTKERLPFYEEIYKKIWKITGKPKSILDLGCGYNPFSFKFMKLKKVKYFAVELTKKDCKTIQNFFDKTANIEGEAIQINLEDEKNFDKLPKADIAFLFKLLDTIDRKRGHLLSKKLIEKIKSKWIIISFATKTIGQKTMKRKNYRGKWLENYLKLKNRKYEKFEIPTEIFYVIKNED